MGTQRGFKRPQPLRGCKRNDGRTLGSRYRRGLFKKRIARSGQGKRSGFRTLVATNKGDCWFFVFGFPKNERSNINKKEEEALKKLTSVLLSYTLEDLEKAKLKDELMEVICNGEEEISDS